MKMWHRILLAVVSAVLANLVFAPVSWHWLAVAAWIPLLFALVGASPRVGAWLGFGHGVLFYGGTMTWVADVFGAWSMLPPLVVIMALFSLLFGAGFAFGFHRYGASGKLALFAGLWWVVTEFVRSEIYWLEFPWLTPGVGLGPSLLSPVFGVYAMSFLIITAGVLLLKSGSLRVSGVTLLVIALLLSVLMPKAEIGDQSLRVMALQIEEAPATHLMRMVEEHPTEVDVVVFPEYSITYDVRKSGRTWARLQQLAKEKNWVMVVGTQTDFEDSYYNTALTFDGNGVLGEHYKNHTVHFFNDGVKGTEAKSVETPKGLFGTPICFDCDYEDVVRKMTQSGAECFIIPSLDATHWGMKQHLQHAELFRHRAAENGRWMMVASGAGMTQLIDAYGNRIDALEQMKEGVLVGNVALRSELTLFTQGGWLFPWIGMLAGVIWMLSLLIRLALERKKWG